MAAALGGGVAPESVGSAEPLTGQACSALAWDAVYIPDGKIGFRKTGRETLDYEI
ncbi:hypothetical protein CNE_2c10430 [Cupriavidus necator N-1]|uniref:Uncharacterized protein n=1 Tax=Cupriavidus necator (strain ATCC 43291 / DSM 13513 / CCUG 52238 / LMG 8453 / N-1) TaxID=1042878 RepID=F8GTQ5_CUPNN|nr:hypothetical protein CNE_2c10430 [Cupriavidus necator N-1]KAI3599352.1 hypothetical protein D8I24_4847 [Cupriavidus necator H850]